MSAIFPTPFPTGFRLIDGNALNAQFANPTLSSQDNITAHAGGGKTNAVQLTAALNRITVCATSGDSVKLPKAIVGKTVSISNDGVAACRVFGKDSDTINGVATGTGVLQAAGSTIEYQCLTTGNWLGLGAADGAYTGSFDGVLGGITPAAATVTTLTASGAITGGSSSDIAINTDKFTVAASSGNTVVGGTFTSTGNATFTAYALRSVGNALTAAGTTRADALQLAKEINRITTAAASTGVVLPVGVVGMRITVFNAGANAIKVYASGSETIDGTAGATGVTLTNAKRCDYFFVASNTWVSAQLGDPSA